VMAGWLGVEPRHLEALQAVLRAGSFRGAAVRLGLAQSALSERIAQLERLVGGRVVERSRGRAQVALTDVGTRLAGHAEDILAGLDAALADVRAAADGAVLRIGAFEAVAGRLVPCAIARLLADASRARVLVRVDRDWRRLCPLVAEGELDAALGELPLPRGPFTVHKVVADSWALVVHADSPLARRGVPPTPEELAALALVAPCEPFRDTIVAHLGRSGVEPRFVSGPLGDAAVRELVARGEGAAVLPRLAIPEGDPRLATIGLEGVLPVREVVLYWHRDRARVAMIERLLAALEAAGAAKAAVVG
jgi:LysR family hydrogen peroxide-inducible transcriptional activator